MKLLKLLLSLTTTALIASNVPNAFEVVPDGEADKIYQLTAKIQSRIQHHRDAHPKAHGCIDGMTVKVTAKDSVGFFQAGSEYAAMARLSSGSGNPLADDGEGGVQGFALKMFLTPEQQAMLVPVHGEVEYVPSKYYKTFDIVTISHLTEFIVENVDDYFAFFAAQGAAARATAEATKAGATEKQITALRQQILTSLFIFPKTDESPEIHKIKTAIATTTTVFPQPGKSALGLEQIKNEIIEATLRVKPRLREAKLLASMAAAAPKNVLLETYGSWVPSLYGKQAVKYRIKPCDGATKPEDYVVPESIQVKGNPNFLRDTLKYELTQNAQCFKLLVQPFTDSMEEKGIKIEDAVAHWPEELSPYVEVAEITIPKKQKGAELVDDALCEAGSNHPGHTSSAHYPIGGIQRARVGAKNESGKPFEGIYTVISKTRNENRKRN